MIDVYKLLKNTSVEGPGVRFCIWTQGCKKHCPKCWAKETWEFGIGQKYSVEDLYNLILKEKNKIEGVTFLGGEPFEQAFELAQLAKKIKSQNLSVVCFTGYTVEQLREKQDEGVNLLLQNIDLLIDGAFEYENFDLSRPWVGSSNQRYIFLTDFYSQEVIDLYKNKVEMRISTDGRLEINGMGDFSKINKDFYLQLGKDNVK